LEPLPGRDQLTASPHSYPSAQWAGDFELGSPGLRPLHSVHSYRVLHAAHELNAGRGFINPAQCRSKVKNFNQKVKEKDKEYAYMARSGEMAEGDRERRGRTVELAQGI
jgi:hypothetical protein